MLLFSKWVFDRELKDIFAGREVSAQLQTTADSETCHIRLTRGIDGHRVTDINRLAVAKNARLRRQSWAVRSLVDSSVVGGVTENKIRSLPEAADGRADGRIATCYLDLLSVRQRTSRRNCSWPGVGVFFTERINTTPERNARKGEALFAEIRNVDELTGSADVRGSRIAHGYAELIGARVS